MLDEERKSSTFLLYVLLIQEARTECTGVQLIEICCSEPAGTSTRRNHRVSMGYRGKFSVQGW